MFIVIEGCDGTGKSTLAEAVLREMQAVDEYSTARLIHYGVPDYDPDSPLTIGQQAMNQLLTPVQGFNFQMDNIVVDRFHWGEPVYAPVFRPDRCVDPLFGTLTHGEFYHVENWLQSIGAVTAFVDNDEDTILARVTGRDVEDLIADSNDAVKNIRLIRERYHSLLGYITHENRRNPTLVERVRLDKLQDTEVAARDLVTTAKKREDEVRRKMFETMDRPFKGSQLVALSRPKLFRRQGW